MPLRGNVPTRLRKLEDENLRHLAENTGGLFLHITSAGIDLSDLVTAVQTMETQTYEGSLLASLEDRFQWPLALAATLLVAFLAIAPVGSSKEVRS